MKKFLLLTAILLIGFSLVACASSVKNNTFLIKQSNQQKFQLHRSQSWG